MNYRIVKDLTLTGLEEKVNRWVGQGWRPQGGVSYYNDGLVEYHLQPIVRENLTVQPIVVEYEAVDSDDPAVKDLPVLNEVNLTGVSWDTVKTAEELVEAAQYIAKCTPEINGSPIGYDGVYKDYPCFSMKARVLADHILATLPSKETNCA